jgi:hypothetical protein
MASRFGLALILVGVIALTVFLLARSVGQGDQRILLLGAGASALGLIVLVRSHRADRRRPRLFRAVRRLAGEEEGAGTEEEE